MMNTTAQYENRFPLKKLFYLGKIFMISFNKIYFFNDLKFIRKMQSSQTAEKYQTLATATLFWSLCTYILARIRCTLARIKCTTVFKIPTISCH